MGLLVGLCIVPMASAYDFGDMAFLTAPIDNAGLVLNPEGRGDLLLFPYYDVRTIDFGAGARDQKTLFVIINPNIGGVTHQGVAAKIRFREWDKSVEVFDVDIWLSDDDVWVGQLDRNPATNLCRITSPDYVITDFSATQFTVTKPLATGFDFLTSNITFTLPSGWTKEQMTQLGYFEVIGEERTETKVTTADPTKVNRNPANVTVFPDVLAPLDCPNVLMGQAVIVRVADGVAAGYNAIAIANFSRLNASLFVKPGDLAPTLANAQDGLQQLEFQLSKKYMMDAFSIENSIAGKASFIINFPTKHFHYDHTTRNILASIWNPFRGAKENDGEQIDLTIFDRDEHLTRPSQFWSPPKTLLLPYELNVCGIYFGTGNSIRGRDNVAFDTGTFDSGWVKVGFLTQFANAQNGVVPADVFAYFSDDLFAAYRGLPALGLQFQEYSNGNVGGVYGDMNDAWYQVDWSFTPIVGIP